MINMTIFRVFTFDSAHFLPNVPEGHKCGNIHGHTYKLIVHLTGKLDENYGWLMDFAELKSKINTVLSLIDHKLLNDVDGLKNPTCENLAVWLWDRIKLTVPLLDKIELNETPQSGVIYCGG